MCTGYRYMVQFLLATAYGNCMEMHTVTCLPASASKPSLTLLTKYLQYSQKMLKSEKLLREGG